MKNLYLDNAATSYPKAPGLGKAMMDFIENIGCNVNRGAYASAFNAENIVFETRELLCELYNFDKCENAIFTPSITYSLNMIIKGLLKEGDHVVISSMEHNAVMRPLSSLLKNGISFTRIEGDIFGNIEASKVKEAIKENTKAIIMTHASNVCGTILPLKEIGKICKEHNLLFILDTAQTSGFLDIDFEELNASVLCFTGHKSLLGPQGIGGFLIKDEVVPMISPLIEGGTGSLSESEIQPEYMPDKFESGTMNIAGIFGLNASLKYLKKIGLEEIREKELLLTKMFLEGVSNINEDFLVGLRDIKNRTPVVSLDFKGYDNGLICHELNKEHGISTRSGLHCAPSAHKTLGTFPNGTVRFSFNHCNTVKDIEYALDAINRVIKK